jgi:hypothetical protein
MPPRTDCSAGMSCGGLRLPSELRVPSIESRCVTDKTAVLRYVPRRIPRSRRCCSYLSLGCLAHRNPAARQGQYYHPALTAFVGWHGRHPRVSTYPQLVEVIHIGWFEHGHGGMPKRPASVENELLLLQKQLSRYVSTASPGHQAHIHAQLWISCGLRAPACAQPVGQPVDIKKDQTQMRP